MRPTVERLHRDLPVFLLTRGGTNLVYAPGHIAVVTQEEVGEIRRMLLGGNDGAPRACRVAETMRRHAEAALYAWKRLSEAPFAPLCLTIYPNTRCNLACEYCFSAPGRKPEPPSVDEEAAFGAARLVARYSAGKGRKFHLVLHGGGEPTGEWESVVSLVEGTRRICEEAGAGWFGYIATNGVLPEERAAWLAEHFDLVGISCDGPPDIQSRQRPLADGRPSAVYVERTAHVLRQSGAHFQVRATITPATVERQSEIVAYASQVLGAAGIRFEPVQIAGASRGPGFQPDQAEWFVANFLAAERMARTCGCELRFSGVRLDEIHGPYCDVLRDTLRLVSDGRSTACPICSDSRSPDSAPLLVGRWEPARGEYVLDTTWIAAHRRAACALPGRCQECVNVYHCARECPESCAVLGPPPESAGFRCLVQRQLTEAWLFEAVCPAGAPSLNAESSRNPLDEYLATVPPSIDTGAIRRQWQAASTRFALKERTPPPPVWVRRGFENDGAEAWRRLRRLLAECEERSPISIYVHVPFCDRRCGFCDCYSLPLGPHGKNKEAAFVRTLSREIEAWSSSGTLARRPVTTVHFGGGTPNCLSSEVLEDVVQALRRYFNTTPQTEWALESTSSLLTEEHLDELLGWGFTRLHVGIQTLEQDVRQRIGRREPADAAAATLARALAAHFVVSVDIVYGLPGQTAGGLLASLERLVGLGVHGFSLYQLQVSNRNQQFLRRHGVVAQNPSRDYVVFQVADQFFVRHGYSKNHFVHYARPEDKNLYYTHRVRGEDLLALGPTADGVFGAYHYRHPELPDYTGSVAVPALEGGVTESPEERQVGRAVASLMAGRVSLGLLRDLGAGRLLEQWLAASLLEADDRGDLKLTANGSWFLSEMLEELACAAVPPD